jgi:hypothetical protein
MYEVASAHDTMERVVTVARAMDTGSESLWWRGREQAIERGDRGDDCGTMVGFCSELGEM